MMQSIDMTAIGNGPLVPMPNGKVLLFAGNTIYVSYDAGNHWSLFDRPHECGRGLPAQDAGARPETCWDGPINTTAAIRLHSGKILVFGRWYGGCSPDFDPAKSQYEVFTQISEDEGRTWSIPQKLPHTERYLSDVQSVVQLSTGRIIYPFGVMSSDLSGRFDVSTVYSDDDGEIWHRSQSLLKKQSAGNETGLLEPTILELNDGRVWLLMRAAQDGFQWESFSHDGGETWEPARPSCFRSSNAPAQLLRLHSGRIVVCWNNSVANDRERSSLAVAACDDDGQSFFGFREIARSPYPVRADFRWWFHYCYPWMCETVDGTILISYMSQSYRGAEDFHPGLARIDPAWLEEKGIHIEDFQTDIAMWHCSGSGDQNTPPADDDPKLFYHVEPTCGATTGHSLVLEQQEAGPCGMVRNIPLLKNGKCDLLLTVKSPAMSLIFHDTYPFPGHATQACIRVRFSSDNTVYIATGTPERMHADEGPYLPGDSFLAYPIKQETKYPAIFQRGMAIHISVQVDIAKHTVHVSLDDGPVIALSLPDILGICYFGIAISDGGNVILHQFQTNSTDDESHCLL